MSLEQQIREALVNLSSAVQQDVTQRATSVAAELARAAEDERMAAEAEVMSTKAAEIAAVRAEADRRLEAEASKVRAEVEQTLAVEIGTLKGELQRAREQAESLRAEGDRVREQLETATAELAAVRDRAIAAEQSLQQAQESAASARVEERQGELAELDRLVAAVRRIAEGAALSDVLTALSDAVARETSRAAVFVASGDAFQPFRLHGFEGVTARPISRAESTGLTQGLPFAPLPADKVGFAIPIDVGGQTVAVVYADAATPEDTQVPSPWPEAIEILARYAALRLESLTALRTVQALTARQPAGSAVATMGVSSVPQGGVSTTEDDQSARRYARLLVSEIKLYNETAVRLGRQNRDLMDRLRPEIERARHLYEQRVPANVPARSTYFDDELVQTLADGDPALLGAR